MEDLIYDPENWKYGAAAASAASAYVIHKFKKDKVETFTSAEIDMYLDGDENEFDAGPLDKMYLRYEAWRRDREDPDLARDPQFAD